MPPNSPLGAMLPPFQPLDLFRAPRPATHAAVLSASTPLYAPLHIAEDGSFAPDHARAAHIQQV